MAKRPVVAPLNVRLSPDAVGRLNPTQKRRVLQFLREVAKQRVALDNGITIRLGRFNRFFHLHIGNSDISLNFTYDGSGKLRLANIVRDNLTLLLPEKIMRARETRVLQQVFRNKTVRARALWQLIESTRNELVTLQDGSKMNVGESEGIFYLLHYHTGYSGISTYQFNRDGAFRRDGSVMTTPEGNVFIPDEICIENTATLLWDAISRVPSREEG